MTNVITVSITGAITYTESVTLSDEVALVVFRQLKEVLAQVGKPRKAPRRATKGEAEVEAETAAAATE